MFFQFICIFPHDYLPLTCFKCVVEISYYIIDVLSTNRSPNIIWRYTCRKLLSLRGHPWNETPALPYDPVLVRSYLDPSGM